jgi:hypothetical protein
MTRAPILIPLIPAQAGTQDHDRKVLEFLLRVSAFAGTSGRTADVGESFDRNR